MRRGPAAPSLLIAMLVAPTGASGTEEPVPAIVAEARAALAKHQRGPKVQLTGADRSLSVEVPVVDRDLRAAKAIDQQTYARVVAAFASYAIPLFAKVPRLGRLTFVAGHRRGELASITVTRKQLGELALREVEERLGAYQGRFIGPLLAKEVSAEEVERRVAQRRRAVYAELLARLPAGQVTWAPLPARKR